MKTNEIMNINEMACNWVTENESMIKSFLKKILKRFDDLKHTFYLEFIDGEFHLKHCAGLSWEYFTDDDNIVVLLHLEKNCDLKDVYEVELDYFKKEQRKKGLKPDNAVFDEWFWNDVLSGILIKIGFNVGMRLYFGKEFLAGLI